MLSNKGRKVFIYNNEEISKGYAYKDKDSKNQFIGFNTLSNDLTKPKEVINTLYHETSSKAKHHLSQIYQNDSYATNRGNFAQSSYHFLNYGNKNTNSISTKDWNKQYKSSSILKEGNLRNTYSFIQDYKGFGERDNLAPLLALPAYEVGLAVAGVASAYITYRLIKEKSQREGISLEESAKRLGVICKRGYG